MVSSYNYWYVFISVLVAYASAYAALSVAKGLVTCTDEEVVQRILGGAILFGSGIWGMHFIGMMAFHLPIKIEFDFVLTLVSGAFSVFGAGIAFWLLRYWRDRKGAQWLSGLWMGCSVATMHFIGMAAMRMNPAIEYNSLIVILSLLIAILASVLVFRALKGELQEATASPLASRYLMAGVLAVGVSGMHYTAMTAARFQPDSVCIVGPDAIEQHWILLLVALGATFSALLSYYIVPSAWVSRRIKALERAAPVVVLFMVLVVVGAFWIQQGEDERDELQSHVDHAEATGLMLVHERMAHFKTLLQSVVAFYKSSQKVEPDELDQYLESLTPNPDLAAIRSVGELQVSLDDICSPRATLQPIWRDTKLSGNSPLSSVVGVERLISPKELSNHLREFVASSASAPYYIYLPQNERLETGADYLMLWPLTPLDAKNPCQIPLNWVWLSLDVHDALLTDRSEFVKNGLSVSVLERRTRDPLFRAGSADMTTGAFQRLYPYDLAHSMNLDIAFVTEVPDSPRNRWASLTLLVSVVAGGLLAIIIWLLGASRREAMRETEIAQTRLVENLQLSQQLEDHNAQLVEALRVKEDFLGTMSHELRTPLNSIIGFAQILATKIQPLHLPEQKYVDRILSSGWMLLALINDILDLSKAGSGKLRLFQETVQPSVLMSGIEEAFEWQIRQQGVSVKIEVEADIRERSIQCDRVKFQRILNNLVANAFKFSPAGSAILVKCARVEADRVGHCADPRPGMFFDSRLADEGAFLEVSVSDVGIGIHEGDFVRLFKPFSQIDSALSRQHEGSGLGLALVKCLVEMHGGAVSLHSQPDRGTTVYVWLPWHEVNEDLTENEGVRCG